MRALTKVYNDIRQYRIMENTNFAKRWLCPIYKKGDCTITGSYRLIIILNTDYKIFIKAISRQISEVAPKIIH